MIGSVFCLWLAAPAPVRAQSTCIGDCSNTNTVQINNIIECVNIALGVTPLSSCTACSSNGSTVLVTDLITAVNNALNSCPGAATSTATRTGATTPTPTMTPPTNPCPLQPGKYTITSQSGGVLKVYTSAVFPFPPFGDIIADVSAGDANCIHSAVVPFPGGFTSPVFCVPALGASVTVVQTGCGVGQIASKGGADYTVTEVGDTSITTGSCNISTTNANCTAAHTPLACCTGAGTGNCCASSGPAVDSSILVRLKVGDGTPDTCTGGGTANALLSIPVFSTTWVEGGDTAQCPAVDGTYNPGTDSLLAKFPQTLDFTTDTTMTMFQDLEPTDGCFKSGVGPVSYPPMTCANPNNCSNSATGFCLGAGVPTACCTGKFVGTCTAPQGTCMDLSKFNVGVKECKKGDPNGNHTVCTGDGDCGGNGPCVTGACYKDANVHCSVDGDCKECLGDAGTANPTFCTTDNDCAAAGKPCLTIGPCRSLGAVAATTVASGTIGSSGAPTYDLLFETVLRNAITGPEPSIGATCSTPPLINFNGTVDRCIVSP